MSEIARIGNSGQITGATADVAYKLCGYSVGINNSGVSGGSGSDVTITTAQSYTHGLIAGATVTIAGVKAAVNGSWIVKSCNATNTQIVLLNSSAVDITGYTDNGTISPTSIPCKWVQVSALSGNAGLIYIGIGAGIKTAQGVKLAVGSSIDRVQFDVDNLNKVYFSPATNGNGVSFTYGF